MSRPVGFSWVDKPLLSAMGRPDSPEELEWLRQQGVDLVLSLTEEPLLRQWVNDAGLLIVHVPIEDMEAPTNEQFEQCVSTIAKANASKLNVGVHCTAGFGRTGTILAGYFVTQGDNPTQAIARIRKLRPHSIETTEQARSVEEFARTRKPRS